MSRLKLVLVSNHCISQTDANGRSMLHLLSEFDADQLYQIYSAEDDLSTRYCADYLHLTNKNAVRGVFGLGKEEEYIPSVCSVSADLPASRGRKNALTMLLRDLVWNCSSGMRRVIRAWAKRIRPDAVVLQLGDGANLIHVALTVARCCNIPIIVYNTEDYYFKTYDYMKGQAKSNWIFALFQHRFRRAVRRLFRKRPTVVCNCEGLKKLFEEAFALPCTVIYTASDVKQTLHAARREEGVISYCGNLGVGRHLSLLEIGEALQEIDPSLVLDVYGHAPTVQIKEALDSCKGIRYHGMVSYEAVQRVMQNSRLLVHAESFDPYRAMDTRYAFSTKLADYCRSGIPMLVYAPATGEGMAYIQQNALGFTAVEKEQLTAVLQRALFDLEEREAVVHRAVASAARYHEIQTNGRDFCRLIREAIKS